MTSSSKLCKLNPSRSSARLLRPDSMMSSLSDAHSNHWTSSSMAISDTQSRYSQLSHSWKVVWSTFTCGASLAEERSSKRQWSIHSDPRMHLWATSCNISSSALLKSANQLSKWPVPCIHPWPLAGVLTYGILGQDSWLWDSWVGTHAT